MRKVLGLKSREFIEVNLSEESKGIVLSISGVLKNSSGQNYKDIYNEYIIGNPKLTKKAELSRLLEIWERHHLNDMRAGTPKQMKALRGKNLDYLNAVSYLEELDLAIDDGYSYGSAWLFEEIPNEIINEIKHIIKTW